MMNRFIINKPTMGCQLSLPGNIIGEVNKGRVIGVIQFLVYYHKSVVFLLNLLLSVEQKCY